MQPSACKFSVVQNEVQCTIFSILLHLRDRVGNVVWLLLFFFLFQEPTDIPSRKKLMRWVCARGRCVRRGSLL